jgi:hypothetical protein
MLEPGRLASCVGDPSGQAPQHLLGGAHGFPFLQSLAAYWSASEVAANIVIFFNLIGALVLGLVVGYERAYHGRAAGMRTYGLVCMASAAVTVIFGSPGLWYGGHAVMTTSPDPAHVFQGILTGIGFLGAGVILREGVLSRISNDLVMPLCNSRNSLFRLDARVDKLCRQLLAWPWERSIGSPDLGDCARHDLGPCIQPPRDVMTPAQRRSCDPGIRL